jgi:hypothetical protein
LMSLSSKFNAFSGYMESRFFTLNHNDLDSLNFLVTLKAY